LCLAVETAATRTNFADCQKPWYIYFAKTDFVPVVGLAERFRGKYLFAGLNQGKRERIKGIMCSTVNTVIYAGMV
jgi:hypothetical protein